MGTLPPLLQFRYRIEHSKDSGKVLCCLCFILLRKIKFDFPAIFIPRIHNNQLIQSTAGYQLICQNRISCIESSCELHTGHHITLSLVLKTHAVLYAKIANLKQWIKPFWNCISSKHDLRGLNGIDINSANSTYHFFIFSRDSILKKASNPQFRDHTPLHLYR